MKYKIISSKKTNTALILSDPAPLCEPHSAERLPIEVSELFGFGCFYEPHKRIYPDILSTIRKAVLLLTVAARKVAHSTAKLCTDIGEKIEKKRRGKPKLPSLLPSLCGALCAAVLVAVISFGFIVYKLVLSDYFGRYELVTVPEFIGSVYPSDNAFDGLDYCNLTINYEYDPNVPEGTVISQTPSAGVSRRVYPRKSLCNINLTVSLGKQTFTMNDYSDVPLREALLELKNETVKFSVVESYSDTVGAGEIISTSPAAGEIFSSDTSVTIYVSLGHKTVYVTVPDLYGLTEREADTLLARYSLGIGKITYVRSSLPSGTIITQSHAAGTSIAENTYIDVTISAGDRYHEKLVPDLYGLSIEEAKAKLAEYGLVCGNIYAVANGAPKGTVIAQSPLPTSPITSETVSVDIYVSS